MIKILEPRLFVSSIYDIDTAFLKSRGVDGLIMDLDNTLVAWNRRDVSEQLLAWLWDVKRHGIRTCIVSNNLSDRVHWFASQIGVASIPNAAKPRRRAFCQAMREMGTERHNTAVVGDQIFTDILGGNRLNLFTILVHPVGQEELWPTRVMRQIEHALVRRRLKQHSLG